MKYLIPFLLLIGLLNSCEPPATAGIGYIVNARTDEGLPFPVYRDFEQVRPLFEQHNDTTYVINFWATWCAPCVEELPYFEQLATAYADKPVKIVLFSLDMIQDLKGKVVDFIAEHNVNQDVVVFLEADMRKWRGQVDKRWGGQLPMTLIYKKDLRIITRAPFSTYFDLEEKVKPLVGE